MNRFLKYCSKLLSHLLCWPAVCMLAAACNGSGRPAIQTETPTSGTIHISVDESFKPVIDSEIKVFESSFPNAKVIVDYKAEAECFRDLTKDSTRMIIVTRGLSEAEGDYYRNSIHSVPTYGILAYDAIAVIVNVHSRDSIFSMKDIRSMLKGEGTPARQVVMDGISATSTVRFAIDSVLKGQPLGKNVTAARSSEAVIRFVAANENAIGFIGVSWIGNQDDPEQLSFLNDIKIAALQCTTCLGETYVEPFQANIKLKRYPLIREVYYVLKEKFSGVGNNFVNFLQYERGQLIFRRAYLVPGNMSFEVRDMQIKN